jgi:hypothetical protein
VSERLGDEFAARGCPILPIKAMSIATRLVLFVGSLGDVGI